MDSRIFDLKQKDEELIRLEAEISQLRDQINSFTNELGNQKAQEEKLASQNREMQSKVNDDGARNAELQRSIQSLEAQVRFKED